MEKANLILMILITFSIPAFRNIFFSKSKTSVTKTFLERNNFFDFAKGVSIIAVVHIHVLWFFLVYEELGVQEKLFSFFLNNISRFAICIFFITTGVFLKAVKNKQEYFIFLKKKILNVFLPYFFVTLFLGLMFQNGLREIIFNVVTGNGSLPFYFIVVLFQLYVIYPFVQRYLSKTLLIISFFVSFFSFFLPFTWGVFGAVLFFKYFFFFVYGVYYRDKFLQNKSIKKENKIWFLLLVFFVLLSLIFPGAYFNIRLIYGIAVFNFLFINREWFLGFRLSRFFCVIGKNSLWIFLLHFPILQILYPYIGRLTENFYLNYALFFVLGFFVSVFFAWFFQAVVKKIKKISV